MLHTQSVRAFLPATVSETFWNPYSNLKPLPDVDVLASTKTTQKHKNAHLILPEIQYVGV